MRMAIRPGWRTVSRPSRVCDARVRIENLGQVDVAFGDELLELGNFSHFFECKDLIPLVTVYCETRRIIATVFETLKTCRCDQLETYRTGKQWGCLTFDEGVENELAVLLNSVDCQ